MKNISVLPQGFLIGADPELFVFDGEIPVSAHDLIPGSKAKPHVVPKGAVQPDGTAAEFNIDPASTFAEFSGNIFTVVESLKTFLHAEYELRAVPYVNWEEDYFLQLPYKARELGCMPDYNAWSGRRNPKPKLDNMPTLRTAAGHIHIGVPGGCDFTSSDSIAWMQHMIKLLDWHVGSWSCEVDPDTTRRQLYGKAGACRYKPYGVEYRTLSNFWVLDADLQLEVWNRVCAACEEFAHDFSASVRSKERFTDSAQLIARINGE